MNVLRMLWLNHIFCRMVQSTAHVRLEPVINEIRKGRTLGGGNWFLVLTKELSCESSHMAWRCFPLLMGHHWLSALVWHQPCHLRSCQRLLKCLIHNIPWIIQSELPSPGELPGCSHLTWVIETQQICPDLSAHSFSGISPTAPWIQTATMALTNTHQNCNRRWDLSTLILFFSSTFSQVIFICFYIVIYYR